MRGDSEEEACLRVGYFSKGGRLFHAVFDESKNKFVRFGIGKAKFGHEKALDRFARNVADCASGFDLQLLDFSGFSDFEKDVLLAVAKIGRGKTRTYGEVAREVGRAGAARAVGSVMRKNPFPFVIPCHRVVRGDGLGRYGFGRRMKGELLRRERAVRN